MSEGYEYDEFERLAEKIEVQSKLTQIEITDIHKRLDGLDTYVKHMTYFCSGISVVVILILYQLHAKGIYSFF